MSEYADPTMAGERVPAEVPASPAQPDEALLLRLSAQKLWAEG